MSVSFFLSALNHAAYTGVRPFCEFFTPTRGRFCKKKCKNETAGNLGASIKCVGYVLLLQWAMGSSVSLIGTMSMFALIAS